MPSSSRTALASVWRFEKLRICSPIPVEGAYRPDAYKLMNSTRPDVIAPDMRIAKLDRVAMNRRIKAVGPPEIIVIYLSGFPMKSTAKAIREAGAFPLTAKEHPFVGIGPSQAQVDGHRIGPSCGVFFYNLPQF